MATIRYTHGYDFIYRIVAIVGAFCLFGALISVIDLLPSWLTDWMPDWLSLISAIGFLFGGLFASAVLLSKTVLPPWLPTWMYCHLTLGIKVSIGEAEKVSFLFEGSLPGGRWYPLGPLLTLEGSARKLALFKVANNVARENRYRVPFPRLETIGETSNRFGKSDPNVNQNSPPPSIQTALSILGLTNQQFTEAELRSAYHGKIIRFHPDKYAGSTPSERDQAEEMSKLINGAYADLSRFYFSK